MSRRDRNQAVNDENNDCSVSAISRRRTYVFSRPTGHGRGEKPVALSGSVVFYEAMPVAAVRSAHHIVPRALERHRPERASRRTHNRETAWSIPVRNGCVSLL